MTTIQKPIRRRWKRFALVVSVLVMCGVLAYLSVRPCNGIWVGQLQMELNRDLPDGSTEEEARAWFASRGFFHSTGIRFGPDDTRKQHRGGIGAIVPNETLFEYAEIDIEISFDAHGCVCKRYIRRWVRCL